jgi:NAD(P)-dependent dehydrogenase (short-subunit alcohol dehydrogenase family)
MADELKGKVAIVTGASSGIGEGIAKRFAAEGAQVVIADVDQERGESLAKELGANVSFKKTDVSDAVQVKALVDYAVKTFGGLHVMVNNAGISGKRHAQLLDEDFADFQRVLGVNLLGVMLGTRDATRHMSANGGGSIINVSSIGGINAGPGLWAYNASKAGVIHFTKGAAIEVGGYGVRVNCIAPGNIETPIMAQAVAGNLPPEQQAQVMKQVRAFLISRQPLQVQGMPEDTAQAALYLASDRSRYITATLIPVDGGMIAGSPATSSTFRDSIKPASS